MECPPRRFFEFRDDISLYISCRNIIVDHIKKIVNLINQLSHVRKSSSNSGSVAGSGSLRFSVINSKHESVSGAIRDEIHEIIRLLSESEAKLVNLLKVISFSARSYCAVNSNSNEEVDKCSIIWPIDSDHLMSVVHKMQQQTFLELSVVEEVTQAATKLVPIDQSKAISLLACFSYPPYINSNELTSIIALQ